MLRFLFDLIMNIISYQIFRLCKDLGVLSRLTHLELFIVFVVIRKELKPVPEGVIILVQMVIDT